LIVSAPGDVPDSDIAAVTTATGRWNAIYGTQFGSVVVPTHWSSHSAAEHGVRPQESLNEQLVDDADILIALFWHRLGSDTGEAVSGTVEEIERAAAKGAYVAVLRCRSDIPSEQLDPEQLEKLNTYCNEIRHESLMLDYRDANELREHVDAILNRAISQSGARAEAAVQQQPAAAEVWPRIESSESTRADLKGRLRTERKWQLVLANTGEEPAREVAYVLEPEASDDELPLQVGNNAPLEVLAPNGEARYNLAMHLGVAPQARCKVTWQDRNGQHENVATLRFF
jgi:hypothetical protein